MQGETNLCNISYRYTSNNGHTSAFIISSLNNLANQHVWVLSGNKTKLVVLRWFRGHIKWRNIRLNVNLAFLRITNLLYFLTVHSSNVFSYFTISYQKPIRLSNEWIKLQKLQWQAVFVDKIIENIKRKLIRSTC